MQLSVNGIDTFVATGGRPFDPSLPAVVMLHGAGFDHSTWALHSRWFAHHGYAVLAPDLPGHGRSSGKPLPTIADMADWTAALLDAAGAPKARLVGHSMGSLIALETAARHPDKVSGLSLIGTAATMTVGSRSSEGRRSQRCRRDRYGLDLGPRLQGGTRRQPRAGTLDASGRATRAAADPPGRALQRSQRLQRLSERAGGGGAGQGAHDLHPRRTRHDDPGQGRQDAGRGDPERPHRGAARRRPYDDGRSSPTNCWRRCGSKLLLTALPPACARSDGYRSPAGGPSAARPSQAAGRSGRGRARGSDRRRR